MQQGIQHRLRPLTRENPVQSIPEVVKNSVWQFLLQHPGCGMAKNLSTKFVRIHVEPGIVAFVAEKW